MCRMIDNGLGVGLIPHRAFELMHGVGRLRSVPLTDAWAQRTLSLVARDFEALPVTSRLLVEHLGKGWEPACQASALPRIPHTAASLRLQAFLSQPRELANMGRTLYDKIFDEHVIHTEEDGTSILYIDRHLVHEVTSPQAFEGLRLAGRKLWRISSVVATADHNTPTTGWEQRLRRHCRPRSAKSRSPR